MKRLSSLTQYSKCFDYFVKEEFIRINSVVGMRQKEPRLPYILDNIQTLPLNLGQRHKLSGHQMQRQELLQIRTQRRQINKKTNKQK